MNEFMDWSININNEELKNVITILENDGIIVFPTDTVFGIGCNAFNEKALKKLYLAKKRPQNKPFSVLVSDVKQIEKIAKINNEIEKRLIENFMPGPLTIVLEKREFISDIITAQKSTIGIRIPNNRIANELLKYYKKPLATSSANISGKKSKTEIKKIIKDFDNKVDVFINGEISKSNIASTIVQVIENEVVILREGEITKQKIDSIIK